MNSLNTASNVTLIQRHLLSLLAAVLVVVSSPIQVRAAEAQIVEEALAKHGIILPWLNKVEKKQPIPAKIQPKLASSENPAPVKKVWNRINAPDLTVKPAYSSEPAVRSLTVTATAYTSDPRETDSTPFTTANGTRVYDGVIAANFLKFGTRVRIPQYFGDKVFEVHDRMNPKFNHRVDIWMLNKSDAYGWGVRRVKIEILP